MPIFLDRHDPPDEITAEHVAEMHQKDLEVQHKYGCRGFTYWFDDKRKAGFCLIEAPNKEALYEMHDHAHGGIPSRIIEVEEQFVESFLGRLTDPEISSKEKLNVIDESAFRVIFLSKIERVRFHKKTSAENIKTIQQFNVEIQNSIKKAAGSIVKQTNEMLLTSFKKASQAIEAAYEIKALYNKLSKDFKSDYQLDIGISCGEPIMEKESMFEDCITLAEYICDNGKGQITISNELRSLFQSENINAKISLDQSHTISSLNEAFLVKLYDLMKKVWNTPDLKIEDLEKALGYSKSQFYRNVKSVTTLSPNAFIKNYRLKQAMKRIHQMKGNVSEIAFECGFNSAAYFSKCFYANYKILPSQIVNS